MAENPKIAPSQSIELVENYFSANFKEFNLLKKNHYTGYWWVEYINTSGDVRVVFDGDIGGHFSVKIFIADTEYSLWRFDRSVNKATLSTKENILYQLGILKKFIT